jgi:hypothetical protein
MIIKSRKHTDFKKLIINKKYKKTCTIEEDVEELQEAEEDHPAVADSAVAVADSAIEADSEVDHPVEVAPEAEVAQEVAVHQEVASVLAPKYSLNHIKDLRVFTFSEEKTTRSVPRI